MDDIDLAVSPTAFTGRLGIQQRVLPAYRAGFFDCLAVNCPGGLGVYAGQARSDEAIRSIEGLASASLFPARNIHIGRVSSPVYLCWQFDLIRWLESWQPSVLILEANPRYLSTRPAIAWMHAHRRPVIGWGLGAPGAASARANVTSRLRFAGRRRFYRNFDSLIAYSTRGAGEFRALGFPAERIFVAPNAVAYRPEVQTIHRVRSPVAPLNVLFVGRLQARKRIDLLLHACAGLPTDLQPRLVIVGDGPERESLVQQAATVYPQASFTGAAYGLDLEQYFQQADLFVLPGSGGLALQQAMAHGLPVIAAEGDGTQEDLVAEDNGWLVTPGDLNALTESLRAALSNPAKLLEMGAASYGRVRDAFNIENMVAAFLIAIEETIAACRINMA
jgi:glycosyltransferase involved in cell wall biosynthesis